MQDDARAGLLFSVLAGERRMSDSQDDDELRALADLGGRLEALGPAMAAMAQAEGAFDPTFAAGLHRTLLAAHPAVQPEPIRASSSARTVTRAARRITWRMFTLALIALALAATVLLTILRGVQQTAPVGTGPLNPAATRITISARAFSAQRPSSPMDRHGLVAKTPGVEKFSPMRLGSAPNAEPTPSRATSGPAATPGEAHGAAGNSPGAGTPTPEPAKAATAPGPATPYGIQGSTSVPIGPETGAPSLPFSPSEGAYRYQLPAQLPSLPTTAPLYRLRLTPVTMAEAKAIAVTFPDLKPLNPANGLGFAGPDEQLRIIPATGEITYTRLAGPTDRATPAASQAAAASANARDWLHTHGLFPSYPGALTTTVSREGIWTSVRFAPALEPALLPTAETPVITVTLNAQGIVVSAHSQWAVIEPMGMTALISPKAVARANERTPISSGRAAPVVTVSRIILAYQPETEDGILVLRPIYQFEGTLDGQPFSRIVAAEAR
ncbi:MAG TPA: hypothetical protein VNL71_03615 [Chloroflexota bacterium]|nr:hypothetical protein [Chloroflexota bacterium]